MAETWNIREGVAFEWTGTWIKEGEENGYEVFKCVQNMGASVLEATIHLIRTADGRFGARKFNVTEVDPILWTKMGGS